MTDSQSKLDDAMVLAARTIVEKHLRNGIILGLGSGSAVAKFANVLGETITNGSARDISIVPSSMQAWNLAIENSLPLHPDSAHCPKTIDITIDGADQVSPTTRSMIKGGGGALLREKIILAASTQAYILVDSSKIARKLDRSIPVEVIQFAANSTQEKIRRDLKAKPRLRKLDKGYPFFTESGNIILDCDFPEPIEDPIHTEQSLKNIPGVIEAGVFTCKVDKFYVGNPTGDLDSY